MTERAQFVRLFDSPSFFRQSTFQAFWKENDLKFSRLGITIKGKLSSINRTKVKRIIREWFRVSHERLSTIDLNIVIKVPQKISEEFMESLKKQLKAWK